MVKILNRDTHATGIIIGLFLPIIGFFISLGIASIIDRFAQTTLNNSFFAFKLIGIAFNLWPIRYYFVNKKHELTGRGILLVTFIYVIVFFWVQQR